jgi:type VI secretion system secreted protein Hcp
VRKAGGTPPVFLKVKMAKVFICGVSTGGSWADGRMTENVTLNFANVSVDYTPQNAKGGAETPIAFGWDIAANARDSPIEGFDW